MKLLEERILKDGNLGEGNVLKVDSFVNHQLDVPFLSELGREFHRLFKDEGVTKILTIEASGIGIACLTAAHFGVPVVFAKKTHTNNIFADVYTSSVFSYTHQKSYDIVVSRQFLHPGDRVLIIDDFLAKGQALMGLLDIVAQSGATTVGCGIVIEKGFQEGGQMLREKGIRLESLAIIDHFEDGHVVFRN